MHLQLQNGLECKFPFKSHALLDLATYNAVGSPANGTYFQSNASIICFMCLQYLVPWRTANLQPPKDNISDNQWTNSTMIIVNGYIR